MGTATSPNDPVFFLHHCYIDYIWSKWMLANPQESNYLPTHGGPYGTNIYEYMPPWDGVYDVSSYEYYYQYSSIVPENQQVKIAEVCVPDEQLGYVYEGLLNYYQ
jgi:hypothetical protein